jgi:hypothetical protein
MFSGVKRQATRSKQYNVFNYSVSDVYAISSVCLDDQYFGFVTRSFMASDSEPKKIFRFTDARR